MPDRPPDLIASPLADAVRADDRAGIDPAFAAPPLVAAEDLAALATGAPALWVLDDAVLPPLPPELEVWRVTATPGGRLLRRALPAGGLAPVTAPVPLPAAPAGVLALLAPSPAAAEELLHWWPPPAPPLLLAADPQAAAAALLGPALATLAATRAALGTAQRALVAARLEAEALRETGATLRRAAAGGDGAPRGGVRLAAAWPPAPGAPPLALRPGRPMSVALPLALDGLAGLALHLSDDGAGAAAAADDAALAVRVCGAVGGVVYAAWRVPLAIPRPGWLALDLPAALPALREGARLVLEANRGAALSAAVGEARPALRLWTAPPGTGARSPAYWDAPAVGAATGPEPGVPAEVAAAVWTGLRSEPAGVARLGAIGAAPPRPLLTLAPGSAATLILPAVPLAGLVALRAEVAVTQGEAAALRGRLRLLPTGEGAAPEDGPAPDGADAGLRGADPSRGTLSLLLPLPARPPEASGQASPSAPERAAGIALDLRHAGSRAGPEAGSNAPLALVWRALVGLPAVPAPASDLPPAAFAAVLLHEEYAAEGGGYAHLDLELHGVTRGGEAWPRLRAKLALQGEVPRLELRDRADWPRLRRWPGTARDAHGGYWLLDLEGLAAGVLDGGALEAADARGLRALLTLLPAATASATRRAAVPPDRVAAWTAAARVLAAAAG